MISEVSGLIGLRPNSLQDVSIGITSVGLGAITSI